jgi:hypothetical protein
MTALERYAAAYAIAGFSTRMSDLYELDRDQDASDAFVPPQRTPTP